MASNAHTSQSDKFTGTRTTTRCDDNDNDKRKNSTVCHFAAALFDDTQLEHLLNDWLHASFAHSSIGGWGEHSTCTLHNKSEAFINRYRWRTGRLMATLGRALEGREDGADEGEGVDEEGPMSDVVLSLHNDHYKTERKDGWNGIWTETER